MFEQTLAVSVRANRAYSTMLGLAAQSLLMTAAVSMPLVFPDSLPKVRTMIEIFTPGPPPPPLHTVQPMKASSPIRVRPFLCNFGVLTEPRKMPPTALLIDEPPRTAEEMGSGPGGPAGAVGGLPNGVVGGLPIGGAGQVNAPRPPAAPPKAEPAAAPKPAAPSAPIPVGGDVQEAKLIHRVIPPYPPLARQARISGRVELTGFIATDGRIRQLQVLSGHPLLVPTALDAVRQWVYRPTLLNGVAVEVVAPITVHFILN